MTFRAGSSWTRATVLVLTVVLAMGVLPGPTTRTASAAVPETVTLDGSGWKVQHFDPGQGAALGVHQPGFNDSSW